MQMQPPMPAPPRKPAGASLWRRLAGGARRAPHAPHPPPLPTDWDRLDPDQRVRRLGEW